MIKLTIDNKAVEVEQGSTILDAATKLGIKIPTMCHLKPYSNHPSCMVCMVKDLGNGKMQPSCAFPAQEGMNISTTDEEVILARKDALELLLSDHVGDCEAPCRVACPAFMDIPKMNRLIAKGEFKEALKTVKEEIALPIVLGYVCSAPCENACRRKPIDSAISICQLKKYVAIEDANQDEPFLPTKAKPTNKSIAIVGAGVAGLSAAFHLVKLGNKVTVFDKNNVAGGSLIGIPEELPEEMLNKEIEYLKDFGVDFKLNAVLDKSLLDKLNAEYNAVVLAIGSIDSVASEQLNLELNNTGNGILINKDSYETSVTGVFACGSIVRKQKMAVQALAQGKLAAYKINEFLNGVKTDNGKEYFNSKFGKLKEEEFALYKIEGKDIDPVQLKTKLDNLNSKTAIAESGRCMHCDCRKAKNCKLRDFGNEYKVSQKNYQTGDRATLKKQFDHESIVFETEKCIRCGLCVDIAEAEKEELGLTFIGRGFDVRIGVPLNESINNTLTKVAIKCAGACPTGALSLKED